MMRILVYLLARFSEPSSYAGLGGVLASLGWATSDTMVGQISLFLAAGCGLLAMILKEKGIIKSLVLVAALGLGLSACQGLDGKVTLTQAAELACRGQAAANIAGALAEALGNREAAARASDASMFLGLGCVW